MVVKVYGILAGPVYKDTKFHGIWARQCQCAETLLDEGGHLEVRSGKSRLG
jgi:hypothetical protein